LAKGEFALVDQNIRAAQEKSGQPVKRGTMAHEHNLYMLLVESAVHRKDLADLRQYTPKLEELAERDGHRLYLAIVKRAQGVAHRLAGEYAESEAYLEGALEIFRQYEARWQFGRTLSELGELGAARGDAELARRGYTHALAEFETMRAMPDIERTQLAMEALV
jgi:tetratricopeptide (TPR) repeat protein